MKTNVKTNYFESENQTFRKEIDLRKKNLVLQSYMKDIFMGLL